MAEMADDAKIIETVVRAHFDTCDYTAEKIKPFIAKAQAEQNYTQCSGMVSTKTVPYQKASSQLPTNSETTNGFSQHDAIFVFLQLKYGRAP